MIKDDRTYYRQRAKAELEQAQRAPDAEVARVHSELAKAYLERISVADPAPRTDDV